MLTCPACSQVLQEAPDKAVIVYCYRVNAQTAPPEKWGSASSRVDFGTRGEKIWNDEQSKTQPPGSHILQLNP